MRWYFWILAAVLIVVVFWFFKKPDTAVSGLEDVLNENQVRSPVAGTLGGTIHRRR
jgi:hypothetical protein